MKQENDPDEWYFNDRRRYIEKLRAELKNLAELPVVRRTVMTNVEINHLLGRAALFLEQDNDFIQMLMKQSSKARKDVNDLISIVYDLATELRKTKGLENQLGDVLERLVSVEKQSSKHEDVYAKIQKYIEKAKEEKPEKEQTTPKQKSKRDDQMAYVK